MLHVHVYLFSVLCVPQPDTEIFRCVAPLEKLIWECMARYLPEANYQRVAGNKTYVQTPVKKPAVTNGPIVTPSKKPASTVVDANGDVIQNGVQDPVVSISRLDNASLKDHDYV